jgi:regulator of ribosome biosynthesis
MAMLPVPTTLLPREKPLPKPKPETRWEKFAKAKGIVNRKKERMVFDDNTGEYKPRWGYKGINDDGSKDWIIEVPSGANPMEDQYEARREAKKERVEKNDKRRQRNMEEAAVASKMDQKTVNKGERPNMDNARAMKRKEIENQILISKNSTASAGKFDQAIKGDLKPKGIKRKFEPNVTADLSKEKAGNMSILDRVVGKNGEDLVNVRKVRNQPLPLLFWVSWVSHALKRVLTLTEFSSISLIGHQGNEIAQVNKELLPSFSSQLILHLHLIIKSISFAFVHVLSICLL